MSDAAMFDYILFKGWVLDDPDINPFPRVGWLGIAGDRVVAVESGPLPASVASAAARAIDCSGCLVTPGLINAHTHLSQTFMRGLAVDRSLASWLADAVQPLQANMSADDVARASELGMIENLRCGVTTIIQHHKITTSRAHVEATMRAAQTVGIRMVLARGWRDIGARGELTADVDREVRHLVDAWHEQADGRIRVALGPMAPTSCSSEAMRALCKTAESLGLNIHVHVAETTGEVLRFWQREGMSQVCWLASVGALSERSQLVHCVHIDDADLRLIQKSGATVIHCPVSNMRLASGVAPVRRMLDHGVPVCVGTDGSASNDTQDLLETLKQTSLLANMDTGIPGAIEPGRLLRMATTSAARSLVWPEIGTLRPGRKADIAVFDLRGARTSPVHTPLASLIYSASGVTATHVFVDGRLLLDGGSFTAISEQRVIAEANSLASALIIRANVTP